MDDETSSLLEELAHMLQDANLEIRALRGLLIDRKIVSEEELDSRIEEVRTEELLDLLVEAKRRAFEKTLKNRPTQ